MFRLKTNLSRNFPIVIFVIIIVIVMNGCFFFVDYTNNDELRDQISFQTDKAIWKEIEEAINKEYSMLTADSRYLSKKIEAAILREYGKDMDKLKQDFDKGVFDQKLYNLFKDEVLGDSSSANLSITEPFNYILGFRENILAVFSNTNRQGLTTNMAWSEYFNSSANIQLNETLIHNIINKNISDNILLYQTGNLDDMLDIINKHDIMSLKKVYEKYGLDGLKEFDFVNVSYITEYGDIFGTDDYLYLESVSNHKMILVKTSNVYESIAADLIPDIKNIESNRDILLNQISDNISRKSLEFITVTLSLIMLIIVSSVLYNKNLNNK